MILFFGGEDRGLAEGQTPLFPFGEYENARRECCALCASGNDDGSPPINGFPPTRRRHHGIITYGPRVAVTTQDSLGNEAEPKPETSR